MDNPHEAKHTSLPIQSNSLLDHVVFLVIMGPVIFNTEYPDPISSSSL